MRPSDLFLTVTDDRLYCRGTRIHLLILNTIISGYGAFASQLADFLE